LVVAGSGWLWLRFKGRRDGGVIPAYQAVTHRPPVTGPSAGWGVKPKVDAAIEVSTSANSTLDQHGTPPWNCQYTLLDGTEFPLRTSETFVTKFIKLTDRHNSDKPLYLNVDQIVSVHRINDDDTWIRTTAHWKSESLGILVVSEAPERIMEMVEAISIT
jgi:hypothetical protein